MNNFVVFLIAVVPALLVLLAAWILLKNLLQNFANQRNSDLQKANLQYITPVRLRSYERLMLLLERTKPENLILNNFKDGMNCFDLQITLQNTIRQEFAHNLSQQIYVSIVLWENIINTKESLLNLINLCAAECPSDANGAALAERIIMIYNNEAQTPTDVAVEFLKKEVAEFF
ncbi:MAG: hypothetical protein FWF72_07300 [Paludibacter sp.]|nr:hypothetical protein [Paludibacter sp.]